MLDAETDDFLLKIDKRIMDGEHVEIPVLCNPKKTKSIKIKQEGRAFSLYNVDQGLNENTRKKTERDTRRLSDFMKFRGEERDITQIPRPDIKEIRPRSHSDLI